MDSPKLKDLQRRSLCKKFHRLQLCSELMFRADILCKSGQKLTFNKKQPALISKKLIFLFIKF